MTVGYPTAKIDIDAKAGQLALQLRDVFQQIEAFQTYLASQTEQNLIDKGYGSEEVAILKSAYTDLDQLRTIWTGATALPTAHDFRTFAHQLTGLV